tara:strand:+ start:215 stop:961 length:747 start_codon:yes stop_codon:yes gene_type:complete
MSDRVTLAFLHNGQCTTSFHLSIMQTWMHDLGHDRVLSEPIAAQCASGRIPDGRNQCVQEFLRRGDDWLWFVDADMGWEPDALYRLLDSVDPETRPVMGGLCFAQRLEDSTGPDMSQLYSIQPTCYQWNPNPDEEGFVPILRYPRDDVFEVAGTGAAFILIHRSVFVQLASQFGETWFTPLPSGDGMAGEDLSFCARCVKAGIPLHVNPHVRTSHCKGGIYLTEFAYDLERAAMSVAAPDSELEAVAL